MVSIWIIKALEGKTSLLFNLGFANNTIYHVSFPFFNHWLTFVTQISYPTTELAIPTRIATKKAKAEMKTHPVILETKISVQYNLKV